MKIHNKLFIIFISFSALLVAALVVLVQWSFEKGMVDYVNQREVNALKPFMDSLTDIYQESDSWNELQGAHRRFDYLLRESLKGSDFALPPHLKKPHKRFIADGEFPKHKPYKGDRRKERFNEKVRNQRRKESEYNREFNNKKPFNKQGKSPKREHLVSYLLVDKHKEQVVGDFDEKKEYRFQPLKIEEEVVGFFGISKREHLIKGYDFDFIEQQKSFLWYIALGLMLLVMLITLPLARHLVAPLRAFTTGMHELTQGFYKSRLTIQRKDEFAQLSRDFNELAKTLMENETARKRWLANISHELRTPVAILKGELEAIIDGIRSLSLDNIHSTHQEVLHLERLISDLHALTSADIGGMSYRKKNIDLVAFIAQESPKLEHYLHQQGMSLTSSIKIDTAKVFADQTRLCQLLENLLNNSIKYAKTGTKVHITLCRASKQKEVLLIIEDDGVGVEEKHLELLFEHLYRVEDSRNRDSGGSGLGLSICAHIVQAHQGEITAKQSKLGGLAIHITLPLL